MKPASRVRTATDRASTSAARPSCRRYCSEWTSGPFLAGISAPMIRRSRAGSSREEAERVCQQPLWMPFEQVTRFTVSGIFTNTVNKPALVNIEGPFEAAALRVLREIPGLAVTLEPDAPDRRVDAIVHFADEQAPVDIEFKAQANPATAWQLVHYAETHPEMRLLLIADTTTEETREILREHGVALVDGLGNAHIELPGLLFHVEGKRQPKRGVAGPPTSLKGKAGVIAQALLLEPDRAWQVRDLAKRADVSAALVHRVVTRLENEGLMRAEGAGPRRVRRVTDPTALLDLWAEEQADKPMRTHAYLLARTPRLLVSDLGKHLTTSGIDYALTGAGAASLVAPIVTAVPVAEVWVTAKAAPEDLYDGAQADPVTEGHNVVFLQAKDDTPLAFRERKQGLWLANRFRLYADLRGDPRRGREQAENLRREVIGT